MVIRRKYSSNKVILEELGQHLLFGRDNISFKTVNLPKKQIYINLCENFRLKQNKINNALYLKYIEINI